MSSFKIDYEDLEQKAIRDLVVLHKTKLITHDDLKDPFWAARSEDYKNLTSDTSKRINSILNSIVNQRRISFVLTRDKVRKLLKEDQNWDKSPGLANNGYKVLLKFLTLNLVRPICKGTSGSRYLLGYEVIDPEIRPYLISLGADEEKQLIETRAFINEKYTIEDTETDPVISNQQEEICNMNTEVRKQGDVSRPELSEASNTRFSFSTQRSLWLLGDTEMRLVTARKSSEKKQYFTELANFILNERPEIDQWQSLPEDEFNERVLECLLISGDDDIWELSRAIINVSHSSDRNYVERFCKVLFCHSPCFDFWFGSSDSLFNSRWQEMEN